MAEGLTVVLILEAKDQATEFVERVREKIASLGETAQAATDRVAAASDKMDDALKLTGRPGRPGL